MMVMISAHHFLTLYLGLELHGALAVRDGGAAARLGARHRGGDEVLRAGRALLGPAALRHVDDLRRHRVARAHARGVRHRAPARRTRRSRSSAWCSWWRASPSSWARCRSTCGSRTSTTAPPRRPRSSSAPRPRSPPSPSCMRLLANGLQGMTADWQQMLAMLAVASHGGGQHHRHRADEPEAHARLLDHLAHGLPACSGILAGNDNGYSSAMFYVVTYVIMTLGLLRHDPAAVARRLRGRGPRRLQGPEPEVEVVRLRDAGADVLARGPAAHGRVLRQARRAAGGAGGGLHRGWWCSRC